MKGLLHRIANALVPHRGVPAGGAAALRAANRRLRARYDAAQTTPETRKYWGAADALSAVSANSPEVRRTLRNRARYEVANNSYASGIGQTLANDCVGTGARLQLLSDSEKDNDKVEGLFAEWAEDVDLASKLRTMRLAKFTDGEAFGILTTNKALRSAVKLDVQLIEADQVTSPLLAFTGQLVDGIAFDESGNPKTYQILKSHPGDLRMSGTLEYRELPASAVLHYFTALRPGQARGVPEIAPALLLFGQLRRYTVATLAAAEVAADFALVIQATGSADGDGPVAVDAMDEIELAPRMATTLPQGWELGQAKPEQPTTTYGDFKAQLLNEIARCLNMPFNVAAGNSSSYNYASGRLDHLEYFREIRVEQSRIRRAVLDRVFAAWIAEASLIEGFLPQPFRTRVQPRHTWFFDGHEHVDPSKEANAQETRLRNLTTSLTDEYARQGKDVAVELTKISREQELIRKLGIVQVQAGASQPQAVPAGGKEDDDG